MKRDLVAGIDCSTQSTTVVLRRRADGAAVGEARSPHPPTTPPRSEQDPEAWWAALQECLRQLGGAHDLSRVAAVSVGGQGHGLVLLDGTDAPLRPAKLWNDTESAPDAERLCALLDPAEWARRTGCVPGPALTVSKLAWTARVAPDVLDRVRRIMLPADYIVYRLSGACVTERGGSSGTGYFDAVLNRWLPDLARLATGRDLEPTFPRIVASAAPAGEVGAGPLAGAVVGAGTGDNMAAALALGLAAGDVVISLGTSGTVYAITPDPVIDPSGTVDGFADATGRYMPMVTTLNAAKVTDAVRRLLGVDHTGFDALALACHAGAPRPVLVPHLDGKRTPDLPHARGTLFSIRSDVSREGFARSAVEGVLCNLLAGLDVLAVLGARLDGRLVLTGGAARSSACRQILADLSGRPVVVSEAAEAAAAGACVQAEAALTGRSIDDLSAAWSPPSAVVAEPRAPADAVAMVRARYAAAARLAAELPTPSP